MPRSRSRVCLLFAALEGSTSRPSGYCARAVGGHALINNPPSAICKTKAATVFIAPPRLAHDVGFQRYRKKPRTIPGL